METFSAMKLSRFNYTNPLTMNTNAENSAAARRDGRAVIIFFNREIRKKFAPTFLPVLLPKPWQWFQPHPPVLLPVM